ncbi:MAG: hypothetical protein P9M06_02480 [Candidatus Saelkia tenebricola]|nr:hypothetical protein [Candidatus Saelkia tenebricola]
MQGYIFLRFLFLGVPVLCYYDKGIALLALVVLFVLFSVFEFSRFLGKSLDEKIRKKYFFFLVPIGEKRIAKLLYLTAALFIVVNFFEKDVAIFSISVALIYGVVSLIFNSFAKVKIKNNTLEGIIAGIGFAYITGIYLGNDLNLGQNVIISSVIAAPLTELIISCLDENFSVPFFVAVAAQFVKNSF